MKKTYFYYLLLVIILSFLVGLCIALATSTSYAMSEFEERVESQVQKLPKYMMEYVYEIRVKEKASYVREGWTILAEANSNYVITVYENPISDEQINDILRHEIGHCVYWKTKQTYWNLEIWADMFRYESYHFSSVEGILSYISKLLY